jgi:hypothetical protein
MTLRSFLIGLVCIGLVSFIIAWAELVAWAIPIGMHQFPPVVMAMLFLLLLANTLTRRLWPGKQLRKGELLSIYCMMLIGAMVSSRGLMERLLALMVGLNYYADETNRWQSLFFPYVRRWLVPWDPSGPTKQPIVVSFFERLSEGQSLPVKLWIGPLAAWGFLFACVCVCFICMATILRRQWADNERLSFPLAQLPVEMIGGEGGTTFLSSRLMWFGFCIPTAIYMLNGLAKVNPSLPSVRLDWVVNDWLRFPPWDQLALMPIKLSFAAIGFFYLLPAEILFSFWFFFLLGKAQDVIAISRGTMIFAAPHAAVNDYLGYQTQGAFLVFAASLLFMARGHLKRIVSRHPYPDEGEELLSYRRAIAGFAVGFVGIVAWCAAAGMSITIALFEIGVYIMVQGLIMARCTSEAGLLMAEGSFTPRDVLGLFVDQRTFGPRSLTALAWTQGILTRDLRGMTLTAYLDAQKVADGIGERRKPLLPTFVVALLCSFLIAAAIQLPINYYRGGVTLHPYPADNAIQFFREHAPLMQGLHGRTWKAPLFFAVGGAVTALLSLLRIRFTWWPLHPLGYVMCASWAVVIFWFAMLVAWVLKVLTVHYGGLRLYTKARPFFLGLIFGELLQAVLWTVAASIWNIAVPAVPLN